MPPDLKPLDGFSPTLPSSSIQDDDDMDLTTKHNRKRSTSDNDAEEQVKLITKRRKTDPVVQVSGLVYPRSMYTTDSPDASPVINPEWQAIAELQAVWDKQDHDSEEHIIWKLDDFSVYRPRDGKRHAGEFIALHNLMVDMGPKELWLDGILSFGKEKKPVQGVAFQELTVEGYGDEHVSSLDGKICVRSVQGKKDTVWYELGQPDSQYARYHQPYLWIAHFGKFFVDFLIEETNVNLNDFHTRFHGFITTRYPTNKRVQEWQQEHKSTDFRQAVVANMEYLWKESWGLSHEHGLEDLVDHPLWGEIRCLTAIPEEPSKYNKTVVTSFVYESFKQMPFVSQMKPLDVSNKEVEAMRRARRDSMRLTPLDCSSTPPPIHAYRPKPIQDIQKGDVVCIEPDKDTAWKDSASDHWYAYVQNVRKSTNGRMLDLLWLYEPKDTTLGHSNYPFQNELFMSDNCSCGQDAQDADTVLGAIDVSWFAIDPRTCGPNSFLVRQKFRTVQEDGAYDLVQLQESDFYCSCTRHSSEWDDMLANYTLGDTVLVHESQARCLEPAQIVAFSSQEQAVVLRRLARSCRDDSSATPNQLTVTTERYSVDASRIVRRCYVRSFSTTTSVSIPFNRDGAGDLFFVISDANMDTLHLPQYQVWLPADLLGDSRKLKALGIFCGGGNLDRGLEEGGGLRFGWVVDSDKSALHTYRANLLDTERTQFFLGSVDDYLAKAIQGLGLCDLRIAQIGDVEIIVAGSPCPGFSILQRNRESLQSLRNCSLIAAVVSYVDFYMPRYMILENVTGVAKHPKDRPELNVFSQVLSTLVAIGYQVQQHLIEPSDNGSCQSRARVFIIATAPGCTPPPKPPQTHRPGTRGYYKSIGRASNGLAFGRRSDEISPFDAVSVSQVMGDLPDISDSHVQSCIQYPDHRVCRNENSLTRNMMNMIPRWPSGMGFVQTVNMRDDPQHSKRTPMGKRQIESYAWKNKYRAAANSKSWSRLYPDRLIGCLTTSIHAQDSFLGRVMHWDQPRLITVMEARRAQGFPDNEVIVGMPTTQWRIVGNSVDRKVALALGLSLGKAWWQTLQEGDEQHSSASTQIDSRVRTERVNAEDNQRALVAQTSTLSVTNTKSTTMHHLLTPEASGPATPSSATTNHEIIVAGTKERLFKSGVGAQPSRTRRVTSIQSETIVVDDSSRTVSMDSIAGSSIRKPLGRVELPVLPSSALAHSPAKELRTATTDTHQDEDDDEDMSDCIVVEEFDPRHEETGEASASASVSVSELRRMKRNSKHGERRPTSRNLRGIAAPSSHAGSTKVEDAEMDEDGDFPMAMDSLRGSQKSRLTEEQRSQRSSIEASTSRNTRRSGDGVLFQPSSWDGLVEHSVPSKASKLLD